MSRGLRGVARYVREGRARLDASLAEARLLASEGLLDGARVQFQQFARQLDRNMRLEEHLLGWRARDHARVRALVDTTGSALELRDTPAFVCAVDRLRRAVQAHHRKERARLDALSV